MSEHVFRGILVPVLTPFRPDLSPDADAFLIAVGYSIEARMASRFLEQLVRLTRLDWKNA